jgi:hypothetical protein
VRMLGHVPVKSLLAVLGHVELKGVF